MYDPRLNDNIDWRDLPATDKVRHLIDENAWLIGEMLGKQGIPSTHENNMAIARRFVRSSYRELWQTVHGNFYTWPEPNALEKMVGNTTSFRVRAC